MKTHKIFKILYTIRKPYKSLVRNFERKSPLGRSTCREEDKIKTDLRKISLGLSGSGLEPVSGPSENGEEMTSSIKGDKFTMYVKRYFSASSRNYCCHGKATISPLCTVIKYYECVLGWSENVWFLHFFKFPLWNSD
jgi:hypothetical protein